MVHNFIPVKNKSAASIQITAEQILRDAYEQHEERHKAPVWEIRDKEELEEYRLTKRRDFERWLTHRKTSIPTFMRYAKWEESQNDLVRARSVYERALEITVRDPTVWMLYSEMEIRNKNINLARNILDRAVVLLPRVSQLWYKYIHMEETVKNYAGVRQLFERWMEWKPEKAAWKAYIKWEMRNGEHERVREIFRRFVETYPEIEAFLKWAKFEESKHDLTRSRSIYEAAVEILTADLEVGIEETDENINQQELLFKEFALFEERSCEYDRARTIYIFALDNLPKAAARRLYKEFIKFEKKFGDRDHIEAVILNKRRFQYEDELNLNPNNYDIWFDYIRLEESTGQLERIRDVYERAIGCVPPILEKHFWKRYIYLWINYATFEECITKDISRSRQVYKSCLALIPHDQFSFSKIWILAAKLEIRQLDLTQARKIYGQALGKAPSEKVYMSYIEMEQSLFNFDRCRTIFQKWIEQSPQSNRAWLEFVRFEQNLNETERVEVLFEIAVGQLELDVPELLWKAYIDFEIQIKNYPKVSTLYKRLLERTQHIKVWLSFIKFLESIKSYSEMREVYKNAFFAFKDQGKREDRVRIAEEWKKFEYEHGDPESQRAILKEQPHKVKKRRAIVGADGEEAGWEEYYDYIFPDEQEVYPNLKLLETAKKWKLQQIQTT